MIDDRNEPILYPTPPRWRSGPLHRRMLVWARHRRRVTRAGVAGMQRLASLYFAQTRLIFKGSATKGQPESVVTPARGSELIPLRTACGNDTFALFGAALSADGKPLADAARRHTLLFFYGNGHFLADEPVETLFHGLRKLGVNVMVPEYVGYGLSTGDACEAGCYNTADAAYRYLKSRVDVHPDRIVAGGASLGGAVAVDLASRQPVTGLVTLITFTSMPDMARVLQPKIPIWRFIRHRFESEQKMTKVTCPTLIIHSTGDALIPYSMADRLAAACRGPVTRCRIEGAGHSNVEMLEGGGTIIYDALKAFFRTL